MQTDAAAVAAAAAGAADASVYSEFGD